MLGCGGDRDTEEKREERDGGVQEINRGCRDEERWRSSRGERQPGEGRRLPLTAGAQGTGVHIPSFLPSNSPGSTLSTCFSN